MPLPWVLKLLFVVFAFKTANAIQACPTNDTVYTGAEEIRYRICPGTDLQGPSDLITPNVASVIACAQLCGENLGCFKAVYSTQTGSCYFKALTELTWTLDARFDVIQAEQINIARCPYAETTYSNNGTTFKICRDTDLRGRSAQILSGVDTVNDCAQRCSTIATCVQAVFDSAGSVCYIKADAKTNTLIWSTDKRLDVIRQDVTTNPGITGAWSDLIRLPVIPVAAYVVPEYPIVQRMLVFSSWGVDTFGGAGGKTQFADYNFITEVVSARTVSNTDHDMFCPAISSLQDGRILIQGGSNAAKTTFYNPSSNSFTTGPEMIMPRGYQASVTLCDNRIFTIGGAFSGPLQGKNGEIYDPVSNTWRSLPGAKVAPMLTTDREGIWREDNHAWLFAWKNGSIFQAGPSKAMNWYSPYGDGTQTAAGIRDTIADAMCGIFAMYEPGQILSAGGSQNYTDSTATARAHITTITTPNTNAVVERVPDMAYQRGFANAVVLPDGTVLVTGGQPRSLVFTDTDGILWPELFNPKTKTWKTLAAEAVPRNYHSTAILLSDGRVFSGGGGLCYAAQVGGSTADCNKLVNHADGQVFSPPYLFNADGSAASRPYISLLSCTTVKPGAKLIITMGAPAMGLTFALVRIGSVTHSVNTDQRRVPLTSVLGSGSDFVYNATLPNDDGILIPGAYYLFALSAQGVPSVARTVQVTL